MYLFNVIMSPLPPPSITVLDEATLEFATLHARGAVRDMRPRKVPKKPFLYWASQRVNPDDAAVQLIERTPGLQNLMGGTAGLTKANLGSLLSKVVYDNATIAK